MVKGKSAIAAGVPQPQPQIVSSLALTGFISNRSKVERFSELASMNSYPHEFLAHPQPLMFIAGLTPPSRDRASSTLSTVLPGGSSTLTTPMTSPSRIDATLPSSLPHGGGASDPGGGQDLEFEQLIRDLRGALELRNEGKVWLPEGSRKDFRMMLVDKHVRLPARKANPSNTNEQAHSPLSPLTTSSPLYPDGLIAPIWVRKHAEMVPSVFVLFLRLWESPDQAEDGSSEETRQKEKEMDDLLVKEIGERRRRLGERGIKLTVVLMASAAALDSPVLDPRLSYLRRASALSSKASLFVLTPVPADQLPDFVQSLQDALYDSALEYYLSHSKKIRRKRSRISTTQVLGVPGKSLGPQGWAVRYDWKAGWFAEVRDDLEAARRHYEDCWNELARMFASTQILPPRTKRWAEAKVLADCVAIKICKLHLYDSDDARVLGPFLVHMKRFGDLSRGWGIGDDTFEYWSWIARQYRTFAELLEFGLQSGLRIPIPALPIFPSTSAAAQPQPAEFSATPISSSNPLQVLQHPAFYFYVAGTCSEQRKERFEKALEAEQDANTEAGAPSGHAVTAPGFANEKQIDHASLIIELFTKSYSLLKEQHPAQNRVALYLAFRIAETYSQSDQHEMAMRFFERISSTFKRDKWSPIVRQIRSLWYDCAQRTGNVDTAAKLLMEMMCPGSNIHGEDPSALADDFLSLIHTTTPTADSIAIDMNAEGSMCKSLEIRAGFWQTTSDLGSPVPFQISLFCPETVDIAKLGFSALHISFSDGRPDVIIESEQSSGDFVDLDDVAVSRRRTAHLAWQPGRCLVMHGTLSSALEADVQITSVKLVYTRRTWNVEITFEVAELRGWYTSGATAIAPHIDIAPYVSFRPRLHDVAVQIDYCDTALVGEAVPVTIRIISQDDRPLHCQISLFLQPTEEDDREQDGRLERIPAATLRLGEETSKSLIRDVPLGLLKPSATIEQTFFLQASQAGTQVVDLSLQNALRSPAEEGGLSQHWSEVTRTIVIAVAQPFEAVSHVSYRSKDALIATMSTIVTIAGPSTLRIEDIKLKTRSADHELQYCSSLSAPSVAFQQDWEHPTAFTVVSQFALRPRRHSPTTEQQPTPCPELILTWRRCLQQGMSPTRSDASLASTVTRIALSALQTPLQNSFITALLHTPPSFRLGQPSFLTLRLANTHPSLTASTLSLTVEPSEGFIWTGPRSTRIPPILSGERRDMVLEVIPMSAGLRGLPRVRLWEDPGEGEEKEELDIYCAEDEERSVVGPVGVFVQP